MVSLKQLFSLLLSLLSFACTFYVVGELMWFLSNPRLISKEHVWLLNLMDSKSRLETAYPALVLNMLHIILFILQHSLMKSTIFKNLLRRSGLEIAERSIYTLTSSLVLLYLIKNWEKTSTIILWQINISDNRLLWWMFVTIHLFAWSVIYCGSLIMDLPEIIGIKQVYYDMKNYAAPIAYKSFELRHLYGHIRHPSFTALFVILWFANIMTLDRIILSVMFTLYMYFAWSTDHNDVIYHKCQLKRKTDELKSGGL